MLPSSHVAHKISQREKQLQFQQFCRRQQMEGGNHDNQARYSSTWDGGQVYSASPDHNGTGACVPGQDLMPSANPVLNVSNVAAPSTMYYYAGSSGFGGFRPCVDYSFSPTQVSNPASFAHPWYSSGSGDGMVNQSPVSCLTPTRSPHQCAVVHQGNASAQCSDFLPSSANCSEGDIPQGMAGVSTYSNMPPSPPPSPPSLPHRPFPPYGQTVAFGGDQGVQQQYRAEWYMSQHPQATPKPPPPYPKTNTAFSACSSSTIQDLQKTAEKFLPLKKERGEESPGTISPAGHSDCQAPEQYSESSTSNLQNRWCRPAWTLSSQLDISWKPSPQPYSRQTVGNSTACHEQFPMKTSEVPATAYLPQGFPEAQMIPNHNFYHAANSQAAAQYMTHSYSPFHTHLGSPPAYPYTMYPQLDTQGGQYPVNGFYTNPGMSVKRGPSFPCPLPERPVDLPSIGSFLEYLNEV